MSKSPEPARLSRILGRSPLGIARRGRLPADPFEAPRILKVLPGVNPNCSSGMFAWGYTIFSVPIVTALVRYRRRSSSAPSAPDPIATWKRMRSFRMGLIALAVFWALSVALVLSFEVKHGSPPNWVVYGFLVSIPPASLAISLIVTERWLFPRIGRRVFCVSPLLYVVCVAALWGLLYLAATAFSAALRGGAQS